MILWAVTIYLSFGMLLSWFFATQTELAEDDLRELQRHNCPLWLIWILIALLWPVVLVTMKITITKGEE